MMKFITVVIMSCLLFESTHQYTKSTALDVVEISKHDEMEIAENPDETKIRALEEIVNENKEKLEELEKLLQTLKNEACTEAFTFIISDVVGSESEAQALCVAKNGTLLSSETITKKGKIYKSDIATASSGKTNFWVENIAAPRSKLDNQTTLAQWRKDSIPGTKGDCTQYSNDSSELISASCEQKAFGLCELKTTCQ